MKSTQKTWLAVATVIAITLAACGKSKLTDEQKGKVQKLARSTTQGVSATFEASKPAPAGRPARATSAAANGEAVQRTEMVNKIRAGRCNFEMTPRDFEKQLGKLTSPTDVKEISFSASGSTCPVFAEMKINVNLDKEQNGKVTFQLLFEVKDPEMKKLSDVTKLSLNGEFSVSGSAESKSVSASMKGEIVSTEFGVVALNFSFSGNTAGNSEFSVTAKYPDFEFSIDGKSDGKTNSIRLNGEETTPEKLQEFFADSMKESGLSAPKGPSPIGSGPGFGGSGARAQRAVVQPDVNSIFAPWRN